MNGQMVSSKRILGRCSGSTDMLTRFILDSDAMALTLDGEFEDLPAADVWGLLSSGERRRMVEACGRLSDFWMKAGILVHDGDDLSQSRLAKHIDQLPGDLRKRWRAFLSKAVRFRRCASSNKEWSGMSCRMGLDSIKPVANEVGLAVVRDEKAEEVFDVPPDDSSYSKCFDLTLGATTDVEICRFSSVDRSKALKEAENQQRERLIPEGSVVDDVWDEYFLPFAEHAQRIVIVDRYGGELGNNIEGLKLFLTKLDRCRHDANRCHVTVFLGFKDRNQIPLVRREIDSHCDGWKDGNLGNLTLLFVEERQFQRISHGRYIRFDERVIIVDLGMELFYRQRGGLWRQCQYTPSQSLATFKEFRKIEAGLRPTNQLFFHSVSLSNGGKA
jgi:hypothetical protein